MAPCRLQVLPVTSRMQGSLKERLSCLTSCLSSCPASFLVLASSLHLGWVFSLHAYVSPLICRAQFTTVWAVPCAMPGDRIVYEWRPLELCGTMSSLKCSHEIKRHLLLGRKAMTKLNSIFKSRDVTLPTKVPKIKKL